MTDHAPDLWFEDFPIGATLEFGDHLVSEDEGLEFARQFDPQAIHLDHAAAHAGPLDGMTISGWQTCSILMAMMCEGFLLRSSSLGSPGIEFLSWKAPVRPGDRLRGRWTCVDARVSKSRPEMGICIFDYAVLNQADAAVVEARVTHLFARRGSEDV